MIIPYIIYFLAGVLQDVFFTLNIRYVTKERVLLATFSSFLAVIVSMLVLYNIIVKLDSQRSIIAIIIYAIGVATGTFLAMKLKISSKS